MPSADAGGIAAFAVTSNRLEAIQPGPPSIWKS